MTGTIFDIKEFTVHDGPGTRVTVFLKGCPLRCIWCHNPEGLKSDLQLSIRKASCIHCDKCKIPCNHPDCKPFDRCIHACPKGLVTVKGQKWESDKLCEKLLSYTPFLKDGGVTFSGGEPLLQSEFLCEVINGIKPLHTAIETSGYANNDVFKKVISMLDYVIMDIKLFNREQHKKYTGVYNDIILENYNTLVDSGIPHVIRIPLIPQITDTKENLSAIAEITKKSKVELLRYNRAASAKYNELGIPYTVSGNENTDIDLNIFKDAVIL